MRTRTRINALTCPPPLPPADVTEFDFPSDVALDEARKRVYVADTYNNRVVVGAAAWLPWHADTRQRLRPRASRRCVSGLTRQL